jgi:hypothetical protein
VHVLDFESSDREAQLPYFAHTLQPCVPVVHFGVDASMHGKVDKRMLVRRFMVDVFWPLIMNMALPVDTLHIFFESDFRFCHEDMKFNALDFSRIERRVVTSQAASSSRDCPVEDSTEMSDAASASEPAASTHRYLKSISKGEPAAPTSYLMDIVGMCNFAARHNRGDMVFLQWLGGTRNTVPGHCFGCFAMTAAGAEMCLKIERAAGGGQHIDIVICNELAKQGSKCKASFIYPCLDSMLRGSFFFSFPWES